MGSVLIRVITAPSRKTSTPQDSHSQVKQVHAKLSSISTISHSSIYKTQKTKIKTSSTTLPRQVFNVSPFLRKFSESPTKILRSSRLNLPTKDLPRPQAEHTSLFVVRRCVVSGLSYTYPAQKRTFRGLRNLHRRTPNLLRASIIPDMNPSTSRRI